MERTKMAGGRLLACLAAALMLVLAAYSYAAIAQPATAYAAANQSVLDQRAGVFKFNWGIDGKEYGRGSAFLINDDTIVTAYHCVMPSSAELEHFDLNVQDVQERSTYSITVAGDFQVPAKLERSSEKQDMAVLKLEQKVNNAKALTLRDSKTVEASEPVYSLGFPMSADQNAVTTFASNDVAVIDGTITKPEGQMRYLTDTLQVCEGSFLMSSCRLENGSSGGPMLDADGNVIGICVASDDSFYYAASSDVLIDALTSMGYDFKKADGTVTPSGNTGGNSSGSADPGKTSETGNKLDFDKLDKAISAARAVEKSSTTDEAYAAIQKALDAGSDAKNLELENADDEAELKEKQGQIDSAAQAIDDAVSAAASQKPAEGLPLAAIIGIIIGVVAIIAIIVVVLVMRSRKKKATPAAPPASPVVNTPPAVTGAKPPMQTAGGSQTWQKPGATTQSNDSATTILSEDSPDTVILFEAANGGSLTRMSTNEQIPINSTNFTIGRERSKVDYCLEGNSSISRVHARFVVRDGKTFLVDNKAANGTFLNGVKCRPGDEQQLKPGDIVMLADEKFKYNA